MSGTPSSETPKPAHSIEELIPEYGEALKAYKAALEAHRAALKAWESAQREVSQDETAGRFLKMQAERTRRADMITACNTMDTAYKILYRTVIEGLAYFYGEPTEPSAWFNAVSQATHDLQLLSGPDYSEFLKAVDAARNSASKPAETAPTSAAVQRVLES
jgi:hypothetical protein